MRHLCWICWLFWAGLPTLTAYPVSLSFLSDSHHSQPSGEWERYWIRYTIGLLSVTVTAFTLAGCLCCQRHRRPNGFQDVAGKYKQEFKNGSTIGQSSTCEQSIDGLELDVPQIITLNDRIQFEPLPVHRVLPGPKISPLTKPLPPSPSSFSEEFDEDSDVLQKSCREWFSAEELQVPREKLKYLREIGRGWFGKVVEGRADLNTNGSKGVPKHGGVVVRILTEEATNKEKAWFLGEAIPYLKTKHQNVLALVGFCLETDPYLLLFESCPVGDLKGFLQSNCDHRSRDALVKENVLTRMAIDIALGLQHMHSNGFAHTDLSARNCLVASDLSAKLGDYGIGVEKYPDDYYVIGDRALPIRWSAPESLECTDTTIETREITPQANMWSYGIFLWEIATWGERPYNAISDEQVIQMLLSLKTDFLPNYMQILQASLQNCPLHMLQVIRMCLYLDANKRPSLQVIRQVLLNEHIEQEDFEQRWENLRTNTRQHVRSASLQDLRGSIDSDYWTSIVDEKCSGPLQSSFHLGPEESARNISDIQSSMILQESSSETEDESWRGQIERGVYTEKVRQKSKSVTDLMVLVHIDLDSDADCSLGPASLEKSTKKKISSTNSDSDLRHVTLADEFDEALKKLRDSLQSDVCNKSKLSENSEVPKLTLTMDQGQVPILRLSVNSKETSPQDNTCSIQSSASENDHNEKHVLRLMSKEDVDLPLLRYISDQKTSLEEIKNTDCTEGIELPLDKENDNLFFSSNFSTNNLETNQNGIVDMILWNHALESALEQKIPGFSDETEFNEYIQASSVPKNDTLPELTVTTSSAPDESNESKDYLTNGTEEFSTTEDLVKRKGFPNGDEEERKHLSTPDDEQSSDSGFRDKESCEEEEGICAASVTSSVHALAAQSSVSTEEEQLKVLLELDTILDAEYCVLPESKIPEDESSDNYSTKSFNANENVQASNSERDVKDMRVLNLHVDTKELGTVGNSITCDIMPQVPETMDRNVQDKCTDEQEEKDKLPSMCSSQTDVFDVHSNTKMDSNSLCTMQDLEQSNVSLSADIKPLHLQQETEQWSQADHDNENEDEDSSTMSLRSDNSYVSFGLEEEFVTAIRNELREKLPRAQMPVVESSELQDEKNCPIENNSENKLWDEDENDETTDLNTGGLDIAIRYNLYGTPLSPILEERESTVTSESLMSNSRDASTASKESGPIDDVLLVDTQTNKMVMLEGGLVPAMQDDDHDTTNGDISEDENMEYSSSMTRLQEEKLHIRTSGSGAPLPSPEEESKWQQMSSSFPIPLPLPVQNELMSTSFAVEHGWGSQDEDEEDNDEEEDEEEEDNSSSSGEFVWKRYNECHMEQIQVKNAEDTGETSDRIRNIDVEDEVEAEDEEEEEEEFTPSAWNATLEPHRSALRSPDKAVKSTDQKKSVWFKKQRYHCVYEYPKETLATDSQGQASTTWEPTAYSDWEGMMNESRLDLYPLDYEDATSSGNEEFYVSSSNRPFQFQSSDTKYVSQFFPGANEIRVPAERDEVDGQQEEQCPNNLFATDNEQSQQSINQLGELRHTRDRLKLNLLSSNGALAPPFLPAKQADPKEDKTKVAEIAEDESPKDSKSTESLTAVVDNMTLPEVPHDIRRNVNLVSQATDDREYGERKKNESSMERDVLACDSNAP